MRAGKLFHIDLNGQSPGKYDQDFRFGSEGIRDAFFLVKLLEDAHWDGMRHFDSHAYRTEDPDGVWEFAAASMRTYLILADKARRFAEDPEIQEALAAAKADRLAEPTSPEGTTPEAIASLRQQVEQKRSDPTWLDALAQQGYHHERLDQLVMELLLGVR